MIRRLGVASVAALLVVSAVSATASADLSDEFTPGSCITQAVQTTPFVDVEPNRFYTNPVGWAFLNGITVGTDDTHFSPDASVTRAQFATFLHRMLCEPATTESAPFDDLVDGAFYRAAVDWLWENGYTTGKPGNVYDPDGFLTRGELAAFLFRLVGEPAGAPENPFDDVDRERFFALPIDWLYAREITTGTSPTEFSPDDLVTRAQAVTFLYRLNIGAAGLIDPSELDLGFSTVASGLESTTDAAVHPIDGSIYITGQEGLLWRVPADGSGSPDWDAGPAQVLVIDDDDIISGGEQGLLGVAISPDGSRIYLSLTAPSTAAGLDCRNSAFANDSVIWEYDLVAGSPSGAAREVIRVPQFSTNHNGGHIAFGPDGHLYATFGDGGGGGDPCENGQDTSTLLGAILRITPDGAGGYSVPADNPFVGASGADEIYLYGVRNPWKFSFDTFTGDLWVADVGQDEREELNRLEADLGRGLGANLGWNTFEGSLRFDGSDPDIPGHVGPVYEYQTNGGEGGSVTGGFVYRGTDIVGLDGTYLWSDWANPELRGWNEMWGGPISFGVDAPGAIVVSFVQDLDGEVYAISLTGVISKVVVAS
ncbi:MAG: PQQ-dependent sugar dehydrogenase [Actinomycetota bacterium]